MCDSSGPETLVTDHPNIKKEDYSPYPTKPSGTRGPTSEGPDLHHRGLDGLKKACKVVRLILKFQFISSNIFKGLSEKSLIFPDFRKCEGFEGHIWGKVLD